MPEEVKKFETEVKELLHLVIHSLYSNKEIFLRELVANAADAIDKARFESLTKPEIAREWEIKIEPDKKRGTLKISDNGIGMTHDDVVREIGTIARSGTKQYIEAMKNNDVKDIPDLVGQFGVGFYSAFMAADKIVIVSKKAGSQEPAVRWESDGQSEYTVSEASKEDQGTEILLHLKPDCKSFLEEWKIRDIISKYSDFIEHPIKMPEKSTGADKVEKTELVTLNSRKALWLRPAAEIKEEEYKKFYTHFVPYDEEPLSTIHYSAEGTSEFKALLFIPSKAPFDIFFHEEHKRGIHLYIKRVFITDELSVLLPDYLRFVKGVVESNDLPLNVSRELLQDNPQISKIRKNLVRKILSELKKILEKDADKYEVFFRNFGRVLKEGVHTDSANRDSLKELMIFQSAATAENKFITMKQYSDAMPPEQKEIYCLTGENRKTLENSPQIESLRSKNYDVIFLTDPIDEYLINDIREYAGKKIRIVSKGELNADETGAPKISKEDEKNFKGLLDFLKKTLENEIRDVKLSVRLTQSPCCLVTDEFAPSPQLEKIMKAMNQKMPDTKRILEINPGHPLIKSLAALHRKNPDAADLKDYADMLYDQSLLTEGLQIADPAKFARSLSVFMAFRAEKELG